MSYADTPKAGEVFRFFDRWPCVVRVVTFEASGGEVMVVYVNATGRPKRRTLELTKFQAEAVPVLLDWSGE